MWSFGYGMKEETLLGEYNNMVAHENIEIVVYFFIILNLFLACSQKII